MRKRTTVMVTIAALMVAVFATAAYAATIEGTKGEDRLLEETPGDDTFYGYQDNDILEANDYSGDTDQLYGGPSKNNNANSGSSRVGDNLWANDGDNLDTLDGGGGWDACIGDPGDRYVKCEIIDY